MRVIKEYHIQWKFPSCLQLQIHVFRRDILTNWLSSLQDKREVWFFCLIAKDFIQGLGEKCFHASHDPVHASLVCCAKTDVTSFGNLH